MSRVVHGQDRVRDSTRARVLRVIDQLGYVPDGAAQSLSRRRKNVIGLVCVERQSPRQQYDIESMSLLFYDEILRGVEARIRDHDWSLLISYLEEAARDPDLPRLLTLSAQVDGMLIGEGVVPSQFLARLAKRLPVVVVAGNPDERAADVVMADNRSGSAALVSHLIEVHGRRRLYHVDGPPSAPDAKERRLALAELVAANPQCQLVGSSPEILCRVVDKKVTTRPLAGTRKRGATVEEDKSLEQELLADPKERAEHIMLVDLHRNDIGRVSRIGTVKVDDVMSVERYSHVMHITSNVTGELAEGMTALDALRVSLPVGTVSGAPKIRAMQIIDEVEPTRRGPYGGAVGYLDFAGNMDTCIALRTIVWRNGTFDVQAGAGVVADSVPSSEYEETMSKAKAMLKAVEIAQEGF